jgi:hypothetical protein
MMYDDDDDDMVPYSYALSALTSSTTIHYTTFGLFIDSATI